MKKNKISEKICLPTGVKAAERERRREYSVKRGVFMALALILVLSLVCCDNSGNDDEGSFEDQTSTGEFFSQDTVSGWVYDGVERTTQGKWDTSILPPDFPEPIKVNSADSTAYATDYGQNEATGDEGYSCWLLALTVTEAQWKKLDEAFKAKGWSGGINSFDENTMELYGIWYNDKYYASVEEGFKKFDLETNDFSNEYRALISVRLLGESNFPEALSEYFPTIDAYSFDSDGYFAYLNEDDYTGTSEFTGEFDLYWRWDISFYGVDEATFDSYIAALKDRGYPEVKRMTGEEYGASERSVYLQHQEAYDENGFALGAYIEYYYDYGILNIAYYNYDVILGQ